jgi:Uma2 family endonuclease
LIKSESELKGDVIEMNLVRNHSENISSSGNNFSDYLKQLRRSQFQEEGINFNKIQC